MYEINGLAPRLRWGRPGELAFRCRSLCVITCPIDPVASDDANLIGSIHNHIAMIASNSKLII